MIYKTLVIALIVLLTSCATSAPNTEGSLQEKAKALKPSPNQQGMAVVFIIRDSRFVGSAVDALVGVDDTPMVSLENNSFTRVEIPPGTYKFKFVVNAPDFNKDTSDWQRANATYTIKADEINIVRLSGLSLAKDMLYGRHHINTLTNDSDYLIPNQLMYTQLKQVPEEDIPKLAVVRTAAPSQQAIAAKQKQMQAAFATLQTKSKCNLTNKDWTYTKGDCKNGMAHGKGNAKDLQGLLFMGTFKDGQRVKGEIHQDGNMIFSGNLVDDKPNGNAICYHEGEYEECRFFKGKRIDTLYKIRKENAKNQENMAKLQQTRSASSSQQKGAGDYAAEALKREAANRAASFIFDQLF